MDLIFQITEFSLQVKFDLKIHLSIKIYILFYYIYNVSSWMLCEKRRAVEALLSYIGKMESIRKNDLLSI